MKTPWRGTEGQVFLEDVYEWSRATIFGGHSIRTSFVSGSMHCFELLNQILGVTLGGREWNSHTTAWDGFWFPNTIKFSKSKLSLRKDDFKVKMKDSIKYLKNNCAHLLPKRRHGGNSIQCFNSVGFFFLWGVWKGKEKVLPSGNIIDTYIPFSFSKRPCGIYRSGNTELTLHPITSTWFLLCSWLSLEIIQSSFKLEIKNELSFTTFSLMNAF